MRRVAVRELTQGAHTYRLRVVELEDDREENVRGRAWENAWVLRHYPLVGEPARTEWLPVAVEVDGNGRMKILKN